MSDLPIIITTAGLMPTPPATIRAELLALVAATNPDYTATLPGSLIEDISSTDVGAIALCDSALVELVNSLTPKGANAFLLNQLGQIYGVQLGQETNTSVFVVFTGTPGFVISVGFTVSDGTFQYTIQDGGIIGAGGSSPQLFCVATITGSWAVAAGTVTQLITSVPSSVTLSVTNPLDGIPASAAETEESYRARVLQAGLAVSTGMATFLKTLLGNVSGVQTRLISVLQQVGIGWEIIVGGGDPYEVAYAIYTALFDVSSLVGSTLTVAGITNANPGVVSTTINHNYTTGQACVMAKIVGMTELNDVPLTATVIDEKRFSIGIDTTLFTAYASGGVVTPNLRNVVVDVQDYPNAYQITFVNPPQQTVTMAVTWNTTATNFVSAAAVAQLSVPALTDYINSIAVGQPINLFELQATFQQSISTILSPQLLTRMVFAVSINGIGTAPESGTGIIAGDPESYFFAVQSGITVSQG